MELRYLTPLTAAEQRAHGIEAPQPHAVADRVRFAELDTLAHVNNKAYLTWFESLRIDYMDRFCMPFFEGGPRPRTLVRNLELQFLREMLAGESYIATARVTAFRNSSFTMDQQLWSGDLRARMSVVMVLRSADGQRPVPLPDPLRAELTHRDGATDER